MTALQTLADAWDAAAAEIEAAAAVVAEHAPHAVHPGHKLIARGRARQLTACANELRRALMEAAS